MDMDLESIVQYSILLIPTFPQQKTKLCSTTTCIETFDLRLIFTFFCIKSGEQIDSYKY